MNPARDHHYIPVFYLKRWAGKDGKLFEFSRPHDTLAVKRVGPKGTGFQRDLYSYLELPPDERQVVETRFFKNTDQLASVALSHLYRPDPAWNAHLVTAWSRFVVNFRVRHPDPIRELREHIATTWRQTDEHYEMEYAKVRAPHHPATMAEYMAGLGSDMQHKIQLRLLLSALDNERIGQRINEMIWHVITFPTTTFPLLTSDWPAELAFSKGVVSLPIGPRKLFVATSSEDILKRILRTPLDKLAKSMNRLVVERARRYVYAHNTSQTEFIRNHLSKDKEPSPLWPSLGSTHAQAVTKRCMTDFASGPITE